MELGAWVARTGHPLPAGFATCSGRGPHQPPVPATTPREDQLSGEHGSLSRTPSSPNSLRHTSLSSFHQATLTRGHQSRPVRVPTHAHLP